MPLSGPAHGTGGGRDGSSQQRVGLAAGLTGKRDCRRDDCRGERGCTPRDLAANPRCRGKPDGQQYGARRLRHAGEHACERSGARRVLEIFDEQREVVEVVVEVAVEVAKACRLDRRHPGEAAALIWAEQQPIGGVYVAVVV